MMKDTICFMATAVGLGLILSSGANAALIDRGNGMIYDTVQNITWLQDANYAKTSSYDSDGKMVWADANNWVNSLSYGGYNDWRLASFVDIGNDGCNTSFNGTDCGFNVDTSTSELAHLWYDTLGNLAWFDTNGNGPQPGHGLVNIGADGVIFENIQNYNFYWLGEPNMMFGVSNGTQGTVAPGFEAFVWAVRDGDVTTERTPPTARVPAPGAFALIGLGLLGMVAARRRV
ncbi:MAG: PEP-CTERM sorting domain-containing protein [Gammaproteobacteria bacterium]|nr:PEP-CTERM sorting domain-containing protein [Gammaproteobacteria bacterium]